MATAFATLPFAANLLGPLQALAAWFVPRRTPVPPAVVRTNTPRRAAAAPARPLRIVRVVDPSASRAVAGRMVISGRMADVCAELDRLAALEAQAG